jgi:hypothetical protein
MVGGGGKRERDNSRYGRVGVGGGLFVGGGNDDSGWQDHHHHYSCTRRHQPKAPSLLLLTNRTFPVATNRIITLDPPFSLSIAHRRAPGFREGPGNHRAESSRSIPLPSSSLLNALTLLHPLWSTLPNHPPPPPPTSSSSPAYSTTYTQHAPTISKQPPPPVWAYHFIMPPPLNY